VGAGLLGTGRACAAPDGGDDLPLGLVALCCGLLNAHTQPQSRTRPCCPRHSTVFHLRPGVFCATNTPCLPFSLQAVVHPLQLLPRPLAAPPLVALPPLRRARRRRRRRHVRLVPGANSLLVISVFVFCSLSPCACAPARSIGGGGRGGRLRHVSVRLETQFAAAPRGFITPCENMHTLESTAPAISTTARITPAL
jgi:hypothetical protein